MSMPQSLPLNSKGKTKLQLLVSVISEENIYRGNREKKETNSPIRNPKDLVQEVT